MMDFETARSNMIEQQIRPWNVLAMQTLNALAAIRREDFVPQAHRSMAFTDTQISIGNGEVMLEPKLSARMAEALDLQPQQRILEIGTGTGYLTALLSLMCEHVTSVEIDPDLSTKAGMALAMASIDNVTLVSSDCFEFCKHPGDFGSQFDAMIITGSVPQLDDVFLNMIKPEGRIVAITGYDPAMQVVIHHGNGTLQSLFETSVPRLRNIEEQASFVF